MKRFALLGAIAALALAPSIVNAQDRSNWPSSFTVATASQGGTYFAYGAGWAWASVSGADAYVVSGDVAGGSATIGFSSGSFASGSFTVTPAPGALALLGLAGLAGRRKRA